MKYGSCFSGIEAASVAWHPLGWEAQWFSEIEPFPSAVLAHRFPDAPNLGDITLIHNDERFQKSTIDLLVGGSPCQSFSVAGLRKGLADPRGNLMLTFLSVAERKKPRWIVWENVPGVLSSNRGRDFATFLTALAEIGYGFAYRVLDAQYFGVAQRRRRVFVVGYLGDWRPAAAVLFERHSLSGHPAPRREKGQGAAAFAESSIGGYREDAVGGTLKASGGVLAGGSETFVAMAHGQANAEVRADNGSPALTCNHEAPIVCTLGHTQSNGLGITKTETANTLEATSSVNQAVAFGVGESPDVAHCLRSGASKADKHESTTYVSQPICFEDSRRDSARINGEISNTLSAQMGTGGNNTPMIAQHTAIRRLTPVECERLQGFPDNHTRIPYRNKPADQCPDGPRYKACGNSMAVPVMHWIGKRIDLVENLLNNKK